MKTPNTLADTPAELLKPINYARAHWIPRRNGGAPISPATLYRWARKGVHGVRLQVLYGGHLLIGVSDDGKAVGLQIFDPSQRDDFFEQVHGIVEMVRPCSACEDCRMHRR